MPSGAVVQWCSHHMPRIQKSLALVVVVVVVVVVNAVCLVAWLARSALKISRRVAAAAAAALPESDWPQLAWHGLAGALAHVGACSGCKSKHFDRCLAIGGKQRAALLGSRRSAVCLFL